MYAIVAGMRRRNGGKITKVRDLRDDAADSVLSSHASASTDNWKGGEIIRTQAHTHIVPLRHEPLHTKMDGRKVRRTAYHHKSRIINH